MELTIAFMGFNVRDAFLLRIIKSSLSEFEKIRQISFERGLGPLKNIKHYALLPYPMRPPTDYRFGRKIFLGEIDPEATNREDDELNSMGVYSIRYIGDTHNHTQLINIIHDVNLAISGVKEHRISQDQTYRGV
jgi:hypothetical protein